MTGSLSLPRRKWERIPPTPIAHGVWIGCQADFRKESVVSRFDAVLIIANCRDLGFLGTDECRIPVMNVAVDDSSDAQCAEELRQRLDAIGRFIEQHLDMERHREMNSLKQYLSKGAATSASTESKSNKSTNAAKGGTASMGAQSMRTGRATGTASMTAASYAASVPQIQKKENPPGRVLVCCHRGVSRSCTAVIAWLMKERGKRLREAFWLVRSRREIARPNDAFFAMLQRLEVSTFGACTMELTRQQYGQIFEQDIHEDPQKKEGCAVM